MWLIRKKKKKNSQPIFRFFPPFENFKVAQLLLKARESVFCQERYQRA